MSPAQLDELEEIDYMHINPATNRKAEMCHLLQPRSLLLAELAQVVWLGPDGGAAPPPPPPPNVIVGYPLVAHPILRPILRHRTAIGPAEANRADLRGT